MTEFCSEQQTATNNVLKAKEAGDRKKGMKSQYYGMTY